MRMIRQTSLEAYNTIKENGLLSGRRLEVYSALYEYGPCTGTELFYKMNKSRNPSHSNITTRLGELRDMGVVKEVEERACNITGMKVIVWDCTSNLPVKFEKPTQTKCPHCDGKGFVETQQTKLF